MKYIMNLLFGLCLLIGINMSNSAYSIGILSQDSPENTWDPQFESIDFYRKPNSNNNYENIINFVFGDYWKPHPFRVDLNTGTIAIKVKVKGPSSPDLAWDENWKGEIWSGDITQNTPLELIGTFDKNTEYFIIPVDKIYNQTRIVIQIKGTRQDGTEVLYDTFHTGLSAVQSAVIEPQEPGPGNEYPCYVNFLSHSSILFPKEQNTFQFNVNVSKSECSWSVTTNKPEWIEIVGDVERTGNSAIEFKVTENTTEDVRFGTITVDKQTFTVIQLGKQAEPIEIIREVEVPVEVIREVEVPVEVIREVEVPVEVIREVEVPVEVIREVEVPIPAPPQLTHILVNVDSDQRIMDSTVLNVVDLQSKDPLLYNNMNESAGEGNLEGWGRNFSYELGNGQRNREMSPINLDTKKSWNKISTSFGFTVGIDNNKKLYAWGQNSFGQLGTGDRAARSLPTLVDPTKEWKDVAAGKSHILLISDSGELYVSGKNTSGQLGLGTYVNSTILQKVGTKTDWIKVFAGGDQSYAIDSENNAYAWGFNNYGQLGVDKNDNNINVPTKVVGETKWRKIAAGEFHALGLSESNEIFAWGRNTTGQLGLGYNSSTKNSTPIKIEGSTWRDIACGNMFSGAINSSGELHTWGLNNFGQLGIGNTSSKNVPTKVNLDFVTSISFGGYHAFAINSDNGENRIYCWGRNNEAQLGLGSTTPAAYTSPTENSKLSFAQSISSGEFSSFGIIIQEENPTNPGSEIFFENQTVVFVPVNSLISFSWLGQSIQDHQVKILAKLESGLVLIDSTYPSNEVSSGIVIGSQQFRELVVEATLMKNNQMVNKIETKFIVRGFQLLN
jgi:alpha-tubulin suppressor-like RCC1 family protein